MRKAIIWRKSIYDADYVCKCGKELFVNNQIPDDMLVYGDYLVCPQCGLNVAKLTTEEQAVKSGAMRGEKA